MQRYKHQVRIDAQVKRTRLRGGMYRNATNTSVDRPLDCGDVMYDYGLLDLLCALREKNSDTNTIGIAIRR